jgi:RNA polymerase-binding protein DksA
MKHCQKLNVQSEVALQAIQATLEQEKIALMNASQLALEKLRDGHYMFANYIDSAIEENTTVMWLLQKERQSQILHDIDETLARISKHNYGTCTLCYTAIHPERLAMLPTVSLCTVCQDWQERHQQ